jgi:hypothetical protein
MLSFYSGVNRAGHLRASIRTGPTRRKCGGMPPKFPCSRRLGWAGWVGCHALLVSCARCFPLKGHSYAEC